MLIFSCALKDSPDAKSRFMDYIIGKVVVTQYNNFTYRVDDVDWERSPFSNFDCNGTEVTLTELYSIIICLTHPSLTIIFFQFFSNFRLAMQIT